MRFLACLLAFAALSAAAVWGVLYLAAPVSFDRDGDTPIHALSVHGNLVLCNQTETRSPAGLRPRIVDPATVLVPVVRNIQCTIPGLEFQCCDLGNSGIVWMVTVPTFAPILCVAVAALAWNWRRRRQLRAEHASSLAETADPCQSPPAP